MDFITLLNQYEKEIQEKQSRCILSKNEVLARNPISNNDDSLALHERQRRGRSYYYMRKNYGGKKDSEEKYIPKEDKELISLLLRKQYAAKALPFYEKQLTNIKQLKESLSPAVDNEFYNNLTEESKRLLAPLVPYQPDIIKAWQSKPYKHNEYHPEELIHDSLRGDKLRSKSEVLISNGLFTKEIYYQYEPLLLLDNSFVYPDFLILRPSDNKEIVWEHFGLMDNPVYANNAVRKIQRYEAAGYHLGDTFIATFESSAWPLSSRLVNEYIERYFGR